MVDAIRRGDYLEAVQWLDTLSAVDRRFTLTSDEIVARWRERARRYRAGIPAADPALRQKTAGTDYRGLFGALLRYSHDALTITGVSDGWFLECSDSFLALTGYSRPELLGRTSVELGIVDPEQRAASVEAARRHAVEPVQAQIRRKDGALRWVEFSPQVLAGDELLLTILRDVNDRVVDRERLRDLAERDPLTNLYNRRRFQEEVDRQMRESVRHGDPATLLVVDVEDFGTINQRHGDHVGDQVLCAVARVLGDVVRETDVVARLGRDEFAVVLTRSGRAAAERVGMELGRRLSESEIAAGSGRFRVGVSTGVAELDRGAGDVESLLAVAHEAMRVPEQRPD
jgi:diguanylate cyclase (GGDEF)-like protein/PAS domain S-box-containing protein